MPKEMADQLDDLSAHFGISQSELIRQSVKALIKYIEANDGRLHLPFDFGMFWVKAEYDSKTNSLKTIAAEDPGPYQSKPPSPKKTG